MATAVLVTSFICAIASLIAGVLIVIAAFEDEVWKGIVGFFIPPYLIYWAIVEDYGDGKWTRIVIYAVGGVLAFVLRIAYLYVVLPAR